MNYLPYLELITIALLLIVLLFLSALETVISRLSRLTLRVLAKREPEIAGGLVNRIVRDRGQFLGRERGYRNVGFYPFAV